MTRTRENLLNSSTAPLNLFPSAAPGPSKAPGEETGPRNGNLSPRPPEAGKEEAGAGAVEG